MSRRRSSGLREGGAAATLVAILAAGGVLLGMLALSVDVGSMMFERRQLQNGADATAQALAQICANDAAACTDANAATLDTLTALANSNASDQLHRLGSDGAATERSGVCGANLPAGAALELCDSLSNDADIEALELCPALPGWLRASTIPYVETYTSSQSAAGPVLEFFFRGDNTSVTSCARSAWGSPGSFSATLPIAISTCEFMRYTGATVGPAGIPGEAVDPPEGAAPGYGGSGQPAWPPAYSGWPNKVGAEQYILTHSNNSADCSYKGKDTAGGFGWLNSTSCMANVTVDSTGAHYWARIDTGNNVPNSCRDVLPTLRGTVLNVPVFDCLVRNNSGTPSGGPAAQTSCAPGSAGGSQTWYHLAGFAKFYMSGAKLSGGGQNSLVNNVLPCSSSSPNPGGANPWSGNSARCVSGWFVSGELSSPSIGLGGPGGGNFGTFTVVPAG